MREDFETEKKQRIQNITRQIENLECTHEKTEIRYRLATNGQRMFKPQCLRCGELVGNNWIAHSKIENIDQCQPIDDEFRRFNAESRIELQRELTAVKTKIQNEQFFEDYEDYLKSAEWQDRRRRVIERCGGICDGCRKNRVHHVHHLTYRHYRHEFLFELVGLCVECHSRIHPDKELSNGAPIYA